MRRRFIQITETSQTFKSLSECDTFLGRAGLSASILQLPDQYHERYKLHLREVPEEVYLANCEISDITYSDIVHKYTIPCKWCGKEFHPNNIHQKYCDDKHYQICECCGQKFDITSRIKSNKDIPKTCSPACSAGLKKQTIVKNQQDPNYEKLKLEKRKQTCLEKYGVDNVSKSSEVQTKLKNKLYERYGVCNISQLQIQHLDLWEEFLNDERKYIEQHFNSSVTIRELAKEFGTCLTTIYNNLSEECWPYIKKSLSYMEEDVVEFLKDLDPKMNIQTHCRSIIAPYELDIYLPDYSIAIECNPTVTHNSSKCLISHYSPIPANYHKKKTDLCESKGVFLFHIFGYEWTWKRSQIESILKNLVKKNEVKVYARQCEVLEVTSKDSIKFLEKNHRQGSTVSKVNLGLYHSGELVSIMTFGSPRVTMKSKNYDNAWELLRFCSKSGVTIVGGASKLFKHFISAFSPEKIISFSDRAHTRGIIYDILGFSPINRSAANYVWVDTKTDKGYHRMNTQKHNLCKFLKDDNLDLSKTEKQIMEEHRYVQVFDSGTITWVWEPHN